MLTSPAESAGNCRRKDGKTLDKHLSPAELAEREGVPLETVYGWNKQRTGPAFMRIGRHVRYRMADVLAWEKSRTVETRTA
jgi:excisionase family DNA binding protein